MNRAVRDGQVAIGAAGCRSEIDLAIHRSLRLLARHSGARHAYVCEFRDGRRRLFTTHEWCASGVESHADLDLDPDVVASWTRSLLGVDTGQARSGVDDPFDDGQPPLIIAGRQARSIVVVPLRVAGVLIGFMCLDYVCRSRVPSSADLDVLAKLSDAVALAISRGTESV